MGLQFSEEPDQAGGGFGFPPEPEVVIRSGNFSDRLP